MTTRSKVNIYLCNFLAFAPVAPAVIQNLMTFMRKMPRPAVLAKLAHTMFAKLIASRVAALRNAMLLYSGQSLRLDGHFKQAKNIVRYTSRSKRVRPYSCLLGICGTDGALLEPVSPIRAEVASEITPILKRLLEDCFRTRLGAGLSMSEACPVFI